MSTRKWNWSGVRLLILSMVAVSALAAHAAASDLDRDVSIRSRELNGPILFEKCPAQECDACFSTKFAGARMVLTPEEIVWLLGHPAGVGRSIKAPATSERLQLHMRCLGRNPSARPVGDGAGETRTTYIWGDGVGEYRRLQAMNHRRVRYPDIYPGIDLVFHGDRNRLEFDFVLAPGADPGRIRLSFQGAHSISLGSDGTLILATGPSEVRQRPPHIFQRIDGRTVAVGGHFRLHDDDTVSIEIDAPYDPLRELTVDPVLDFSGYHGGSADDIPASVAVDSDGNLYVAGTTGSMDFPLKNPAQDTLAGGGNPNGDVFVTKLDPTGSTILYSTYLGGTAGDIAHGIAVDSMGRAVITGATFSLDFPSTTGAYQSDCSGNCAFVTKLSADGSQLLYSTLIGRGSGEAVALDSANRASVLGRTSSPDFPVKNAFQSEHPGGWDAVLFQLTEDGSDLVFSTFLGGSGDENIVGRHDLAVDGSDNIYVVGLTASNDFPTLHPVQETLQGGTDAFVAKFTGQGMPVYATYLGGSDDDHGHGIAADDAGNTYVTGTTLSTDFPTASPFQASFGGGTAIGDAFVSKIAPQGGSLAYSTYLGGTGGDSGIDIELDALGRPVVVGSASADFPLQDPFRQFDGIRNFVAKLSGDGSGLLYSTPIGGGDQDISAITFGTKVYVAGNIATGTLPIYRARQAQSHGGSDGFLVEVSDAGALYFAHFGNGTVEPSTIVSEILLTNSSEVSPSHATVQLWGDDGSPLSLDLTVAGDPGTAEDQPQTSELDVTVAPLGSVKISTDGLGSVVTGWVKVVFDNPLGGVIRFNLSTAGTAGVGASELVRGFISPVRRSAINTGVSVTNPGGEPVGVTMRLRGKDGQQVQGGLRSLTLGAGEHLALFIDQLFPNADVDDFEGTITVTTGSLNGLLVATALELGGLPGQFTTLPVTPIP